MKDGLGGDIITFEVEEYKAKFVKNINELKFVRSVKKHDGKVSIMVEQGEKRIPELINIAQKEGVEIKSVSLHKPSLEDVFLQKIFESEIKSYWNTGNASLLFDISWLWFW